MAMSSSGVGEKRPRRQTTKFNLTPNFDHLLLWFPKTNSHSGPIYINSPHLNHLSSSEKNSFQEGQTVTIRDARGLHESLILKLGSFTDIKVAEKLVDELAESGYNTDRIIQELGNADRNIDMDDADEDADYEPSSPENVDGLGFSASPRSKKLCQEKVKEKQLLQSYGRQLLSDPSQIQLRDSNSAIASMPCQSGTPRSIVLASIPIGTSVTPKCTNARPGPQVSSRSSPSLPSLTKDNHEFQKSTSAGQRDFGNSHQRNGDVINEQSQLIDPRDTVAAQPAQVHNPGEVSEPVRGTGPGASTSQMLLLEARIHTALLKRLCRGQEETNQILRQAFFPKAERENREDKCVTGHDGRVFRYSQLPNVATMFAREFVLRRFGADFCEACIIEPQGSTKRVSADEAVVLEIKDALDYWFGLYSWSGVRLSLNQMFRDMVNKKKKQQ